jgi:predicted ribosome quality control (RQC) complex YloA/Tae2 family protein
MEANDEFGGYNLTNAFSQDKDKLVLSFRKEDTEKFIEISVNPGDPYITMRNKFSRARKNSVSFFEEYLPVKIINFEIALYDRIIKFQAENCSFYFFFRGKLTNVVLITPDKQLFPFKKFDEDDEESLINEFEDLIFSSEFPIPSLVIDKEDGPDSIRKKYSFIGKKVISELKFRMEDSQHSLEEELYQIIREIKDNLPAVFYSEKYGVLEPAIETFRSIPHSEKSVFPNTSDALQFYFRKKYFLEDFILLTKRIRNHVKKELERVTAKLNSMDAILSKGSKEELYIKYGNLLLINLQLIRPRLESVTVEDIYEGNEIVIPIDPSISPNKNADRYFDKAKDDKLRIEKALELKERFLKDFDKLKLISENLDKIKEREDLRVIMKELKIKEDEGTNIKKEIKDKFKRYVIDGKYFVFVGKDSRNNDLLTVSFAKLNDYWFHARSVPGSHVVLRNDNTKENMPKNILKKAAAIAAFHSKAKTAGILPVSFTQKKYVVKKKGMEPGKVALLKEDVLLVRPEIPEGCEYLSED